MSMLALLFGKSADDTYAVMQKARQKIVQCLLGQISTKIPTRFFVEMEDVGVIYIDNARDALWCSKKNAEGIIKKLIDKYGNEHESYTLRKLNMLDFIWIIMTRGSKHLFMKLQLKFGI